MKNTVLLITAACLLAAGCKKARNQEGVGTWRFEKVTFTKPFSFNWDNRTDEYNDVVMQLNADHSASYSDPQHNKEYTGNWHVTANNNTTYDSDGNQTTNVQYTIDINLVTGTGEQKNFFGYDASFPWNTMYFFEKKDNGTYKYKLKK